MWKKKKKKKTPTYPPPLNNVLPIVVGWVSQDIDSQGNLCASYWEVLSETSGSEREEQDEAKRKLRLPSSCRLQQRLQQSLGGALKLGLPFITVPNWSKGHMHLYYIRASHWMQSVPREELRLSKVATYSWGQCLERHSAWAGNRQHFSQLGEVCWS